MVIVILFLAGSCKKDEENNNNSATLSGIILAPDGETPIAGATVYIPFDAGTAKTVTIDNPEGCSVPGESFLTYACTNPDGSFVLDLSGVFKDSYTLRIVKGSFQVDISVTAETGNYIGEIELAANPASGGGNFAVVTGAYDRMQDILAKLGMGELDNGYKLKHGTELFDIYDGNYTFDNEYPDFPAIFEDDPETGNPVIENYEMVFINCGNSYEEAVLQDTGLVAILRDYVNKGGKLYVTDQSYDFVEQVFPEYIDFYGSDEKEYTEAEDIDAAEVGADGIISDALIHDTQLVLWLQEVTCQGSSCLNLDNTVRIAGFWYAWALINDVHTEKSDEVKIWITGPVSWYDFSEVEGSGEKPLTVSFNHGEGKVLYSSYHTEEDNPSAYFWPQERILQYLVFEL